MRILIDGDACPVVRLTESIAHTHGLPVILFCDTSHVMQLTHGQVRTIGAGRDAVDFALTAECKAGDVVITQDYGLAAMVLGKKAHALHQSGMRYTNENIDRLLMERHLAAKARRAKSRNHLKGPAKRTEADDRQFTENLEQLLTELGT